MPYRSRLQRLEEKKSLRLAVLLVITTVALIGAGVVWGLPVLVRFAVFLGDLNSSGKRVDKTDLIPPAPPQLFVLYEATNSATLLVRGWSEPEATVVLTRNKELVGTTVALEDGGFEFLEVQLLQGQNAFEAVAVDKAGNESQISQKSNVAHSTEPPKLEISQPSDGQLITGRTATVEIKGSTEAGVRVIVNERVVVVGNDGSFVTKFSLNSGENVFVIVATDRASNQTRQELKVNYQR